MFEIQADACFDLGMIIQLLANKSTLRYRPWHGQPLQYAVSASVVALCSILAMVSPVQSAKLAQDQYGVTTVHDRRMQPGTEHPRYSNYYYCAHTHGRSQSKEVRVIMASHGKLNKEKCIDGQLECERLMPV